MALTTEDGEYVIEPGVFTLYAGATAPDARSVALTGEKPVSASFTVK